VQRLVEDVVAECLLDGFVSAGETLTLEGAGADGAVGVGAATSGGKRRTVDTAAVQGIERAVPARVAAAAAGGGPPPVKTSVAIGK
jgi:hypothetical protein